MEPNTPEPMSRPVDPVKPLETNTPPAPPMPSHTAGSGSTPLGAPASNVGKPRRGKTVLVVLLILILLGVAGTFGYLWWQQRQEIQGYINSQADKKVTELEQQVKDLKAAASTSPSPSVTPKSDSEAIVAAVKVYAPAATDFDASTAQYATPTIDATDKNFATIRVTTKKDPGGTTYVLKKVNSSWVVITTNTYAGEQKLIDTTERTIYGIPADIK